MTFVIKASTPDKVKEEIVSWLRYQATVSSSSARIAIRAKVKADHEISSRCYASAANFIEKAVIEP